MDSPAKASAAEQLRTRRRDLGLTAGRAAKLLGIARTTLTNGEGGFWRVSDAKLAELLARYDDIAVELRMGGAR